MPITRSVIRLQTAASNWTRRSNCLRKPSSARRIIPTFWIVWAGSNTGWEILRKRPSRCSALIESNPMPRLARIWVKRFGFRAKKKKRGGFGAMHSASNRITRYCVKQCGVFWVNHDAALHSLVACWVCSLCVTACRWLCNPAASAGRTCIHAHCAQWPLAVRYADAQGEARDLYGHFSWRENGQRVSLHLSNPLGQTLALIQSEPSSASLKVPGHALQTAPHMEDLMQNALGFALPISALRHWIHAMAAPEARALIQSGPNGGHALRIQQDGWTVYYIDAERAAQAQQIHLTRAKPPIDVKLVLQP